MEADRTVPDRFDLSGRVALVTGGASGIGRASAFAIAARGATVVVADRNAEGAAEVANALKAVRPQARAVRLEVTDRRQVDEVVAGVAGEMGAIDILVHSAGVGMERKFLETSVEDWSRLIDINLNGTFHVAQATARVMAERRHGRIVLISSVAGLRGGTGRAAYGSTKGAIVALGKVMAVELGPLGVTTNIIAPGAIETELVKRMHDDETRRAYLRGIPLGRYGTPEEVADVITFLASDASAYLNGVVLGIDGGFLGAGVIKADR